MSQNLIAKENTPKKKTVLVIGIHIDDCEFGVGGTIKLLADHGLDITLLNIKPYMHYLGRNPQVDAQSMHAAEILNAKKIILDYDATKYYRNNEDTIRKVEQILYDVKPDIIFMMDPKDNHIEHVECALTTREAIFAAAVEGVCPNEIYTYECGPRQSMCYFIPDVYVNVSSVEQTLKECMVSFAAKRADGEHLWREKEVEIRLRGHEKGLGLAEGFKIVKYPDDNNDFLLREILHEEFRWGGNKMYWGRGDMFL